MKTLDMLVNRMIKEGKLGRFEVLEREMSSWITLAKELELTYEEMRELLDYQIEHILK